MLLLLLLGVDSDHSLCVWLKACSIVSQMCVESLGFVELLLLFIDFMLGFQGFVSHNSTIVSCVKKALIYQIDGPIITDNISKFPSITCLRKPGSQCFISKYMALIYLSSIHWAFFIVSPIKPKIFTCHLKVAFVFRGIFHFYRCFSHIKHTKASCSCRRSQVYNCLQLSLKQAGIITRNNTIVYRYRPGYLDTFFFLRRLQKPAA